MTSIELKGWSHSGEDNCNMSIQQNFLQFFKVKADNPIKKWANA